AAGYAVLAVAPVARSARAEAVPELPEPYIPPVLACDAWGALQRGILQQIYHRVSKLVDQRSSQIRSRRITFDSQSPGDRQIFESLRVLNEASAYLGVMADAAGVHPLPAYLELCRLIGRLAMKIGSLDRVDEIFQRGLRGLKFNPAPKPPRALPESRTLTYFQIDRDGSPEEWQNVQNSLAVAIRLNERLIAGNIQGQNVVTIKTEGLTTALQFTLYVVPQSAASKTGG